ISARSPSWRWVTRRLWPGRRRSRSRCTSVTSRPSRGGQPSTTTPTAGPWDSPKVERRKTVPKLLLTDGPRRVEGDGGRGGAGRARGSEHDDRVADACPVPQVDRVAQRLADTARRP